MPNLLGVLLPAVLALTACAAPGPVEAQAFNLKVLHRGTGGGGGVASFAMKPTQQKAVDLTADLAAGAVDDWYTACVTGAVDMLIWPEERLTDGQCKDYRKQELLTMLGAETNADSLGASAGTFTITYDGGVVTKTFAVEALPADFLIWDLGVKTYGRFGGKDLTQLEAANPDSWEITGTQPTIDGVSDPFEVFSRRLVAKCATSCTANSYGSGRKVGTFPTGPLGTVTVRNTVSGNSYNIAVNGIANTRDIAPTPPAINGGVDTAGSSSNSQIAGMLYQNYCFGETVALESGVYNPTNAAVQVTPPNGSRTNCNGVSAPTDENSTGWIKVKSKEYLGATLKNIILNGRDVSEGFNLSFENIVSGVLNTSHGLSATTSSTLQSHSWIQVRNSKIHSSLGFNATNNPSHHIFVIDDFFTGQGNGSSLFLVARDSRVIGNTIKNSGEDAIKHAIHNSVFGSGYSKIDDNFVYNKYSVDSSGVPTPPGDGNDIDHSDFAQIDVNSYPGITGIAYEGPTYYRNIFARGTPKADYRGCVSRDGQGIFVHDLGGMASLVVKVSAFIHQGTTNWGVQIAKAGAGSFVRNATIIDAHGVTLDCTVGASPTIRVEDGGASLEIKDSLVGQAPLYDSATGGGTTPTVINSTGAISNGMFATYLADPDVGVGSIGDGSLVLTRQDIIDGMTPIDAGVISSGKGAVVPGIDYRLRTTDPALLAP